MFIYSFCSISQIDTNKVLIGKWKIKAIKTEPSLTNFGNEIETKSKIESDSLLTIEIKKDSIYIIRERYSSLKDTFAYTYTLKTDTSKYSTSKFKFILYPNKSRLKGLRKWYKKSQKELSFNLLRLTNSQLVIQDVFFNNHPTNPFSSFSYITYYFEKNTHQVKSELDFIGDWYISSSNHSPLETKDTLELERKLIEDSSVYVNKITFEINYFKENKMHFIEVNPPKESLVYNGIIRGVYLKSGIFHENWSIDKANKILKININNTQRCFKYSFQGNNLKLVKNGS